MTGAFEPSTILPDHSGSVKSNDLRIQPEDLNGLPVRIPPGRGHREPQLRHPLLHGSGLMLELAWEI